jgi:hypothetical protein
LKQLPEELADQITRGRSSSTGDGWMSNLTGNLKSAFTNLRTSATTAVDQIEQKLAKIESPTHAGGQPTPVVDQRQEVDPSEIDNINWTLPEPNSSPAQIDGKSIECRFLGCHKSTLSDGEPICDLIQKIRTQYEVPPPPLCGLTVAAGGPVAIYPVDGKDKSAVANLIKLIPLGGDLSGILVDRDDHADVWLLQGLDLTTRLQEILQKPDE